MAMDPPLSSYELGGIAEHVRRARMEDPSLSGEQRVQQALREQGDRLKAAADARPDGGADRDDATGTFDPFSDQPEIN